MGARSLTGTPEHPLYMDGKGWVPAGALGIGTSIVTRAGPSLVVKAVDWQRAKDGSGGFAIYNFEVRDTHSYFAGNANGGAWVHNEECSLVPIKKLPQGLFDRARDALKGKNPLSDFSEEERNAAADFYENTAWTNNSRERSLAFGFNMARADFFRGLRSSLPKTAYEFGKE